MSDPYFSLGAAADPLVFAGAQDRYTKNVTALQLLRVLQSAGRTPGMLSPNELRTLAHYTAFGEAALLQRALAPTSPVVQLTTEAEQKLLKRTALTAFYTPPPVYHALWSMLAPSLRQLDGPLSVLEPAFGTGLAIATMPLDLRDRATITAVELDDVTGQIASFLHPDVRLTAGRGFETMNLPADHYDLVISNVPFGDIPVFDPAIEQEGAFLARTLHDYFLARSLLLTRPGGVVAVLSSYGTLDKRDVRVRTWLAQRAELLGAYRLPQGVMDTTGGTSSGADIVVLRRRPRPVRETHVWAETVPVELPIVEATVGHFTTGSRVDCDDPNALTGVLRIARHFIDHPEHVIGTIRLVRHNGIVWQAVPPPDGVDVASALAERLEQLPQPLVLPATAAPIVAPPVVAPHRAPSSTRAASLLAIYDVAKAVLRRDTAGEDAADERAALNRLYDRFVRGYGPIHTPTNQQALRGQPELLFLKALETNVRAINVGVLVDKAPFFEHPTIRPTTTMQPGSMTPDEALVWCLNDRGRVELSHIAALCGTSEEAVVAALAGRIFPIPGTSTWQTADEYLSGNINQKLLSAERAARDDGRYAANVAALQAVLPPPLTAAQINARLGAPWIPERVVADFIASLIPAFRQAHGAVRYLPPLATWLVTTQWTLRGTAVEFDWGTERFHAIDLFQSVLNQRPIAVYDEHDDGSRTLNKTATLAAREKAQRIREAWKDWVWSHADRSEELCRIYNTQFNSWRRRDFDGSHLRLEGLNTSVLRTGDLDPHQKDAVWMGLQQRTMLVHLPVGGGKTYIGLTLAHEWKRLGLVSKPLITVPNHLVEQWANAANQLYPGMRVLAMSNEDFAKARRGTFLSRIATEEWDVIICAHTSLALIELGSCANAFLEAEIAELDEHLQAPQDKRGASRADARASKTLEKRKAQLETRLQQTAAGIERDRGVITWDELGIDGLIVDEGHLFKNLVRR